jgi:lysophospholipase L1-like esterase
MSEIRQRIIRRIEVFGDSILKGVQLNPVTNKYQVDNHIDTDALSARFSLKISNRAKFGCTVTKGEMILSRFLSSGAECSAAVMDFGGNDCDFQWELIAENPDAAHEPHTPIAQFIETYTRVIETLKAHGIRPILATLPPIDPQRFFDWFCSGLNKDNILRWLGGVNTIYRFQEYYSRTVEDIARATGALLVDLRGAFLKMRRIDHLLCEDGTHPNTEGQRVITEAFTRFCESHGELFNAAT